MSAEATMLCVDGSDEAERAVAAGLAVLQPAPRVLVVVVVEESDPTLVTGTGFAGGVMSPDELHELERARESIGRQFAERAATRFGLEAPEIRVLTGTPGPVLCTLAAEVPARVIVVGSRGRGGIKRALLGSVSDYVVRNAPCPVVVTPPAR